MSEAQHHAATATVCDLLIALLQAGGWVSTSELATTLDVHRNTVTHICLELAARDWLRREQRREGDFWLLGPALPGIALEFQAQLARQAEALRARLDEALEFSAHLHRRSRP